MNDNIILLASQHTEDRELFKKVVELLGKSHEVTILEAKSGSEAVQKMKVQKFQLVVADSELPKTLGLTLLESISESVKGEKKPKTIVILSDNPKKESLPKGVACIPKPLYKGKLIHYLENYFFADELSSLKEPEEPEAINMEVLRPIFDGALETLNDQYELEANRTKVSYKDPKAPSGDISSILKIHGSKIRGTFAIAFDLDSFLNVAGAMKDENFLNMSPEMEDYACDLCESIIMKSFSELKEMDSSVDVSDPIVVIGKNHIIKHHIPGTCVTVEYEGTFGKMRVESIIRPIS